MCACAIIWLQQFTLRLCIGVQVNKRFSFKTNWAIENRIDVLSVPFDLVHLVASSPIVHGNVVKYYE